MEIALITNDITKNRENELKAREEILLISPLL